MVAVDRVDLAVNEGDLTAVIGPNGAGKTTLFNLLAGQLRPTSGEVKLAGENVTRAAVHRRAELGIGRTFQIVRPLPNLSVLENTMMGAFLRHPHRTAAAERAREVLGIVGLADVAGSKAQDLPLPRRKRLEVARALATDPKVLLLDEVMAGLNPTEIHDAIDLFRGIHAHGVTIVLVEHNLKVVRSLAQHVIVLDHGVVVAEGTPMEALEHPDVVRAYLGNRR